MKVQAGRSGGFTLAEILIALGLLGVIAAFTIPKILTATGTSKATAVFKETASMVTGAMTSYKANNQLLITSGFQDFENNMNFVSKATSGTFGSLAACSATLPCLRLHSGGVLQYDTAMQFGGGGVSGAGTNAENGSIFVNFDPDGDGSLGLVTFIIRGNGRLSTRGAETTAPTYLGTATLTAQATDPAYVSWN
ncbi:MAG: type II secretion system protein [Vampirovibrionales bacterium]|nr:type II secretion system protein [Vampirovibrionales bacterium]